MTGARLVPSHCHDATQVRVCASGAECWCSDGAGGQRDDAASARDREAGGGEECVSGGAGSAGDRAQAGRQHYEGRSQVRPEENSVCGTGCVEIW